MMFYARINVLSKNKMTSIKNVTLNQLSLTADHSMTLK